MGRTSVLHIRQVQATLFYKADYVIVESIEQEVPDIMICEDGCKADIVSTYNPNSNTDTNLR